MRDRFISYLPIVVVATLFLLLALPAQAAGIDGIVTWFQTNILTGLITIALVVLGVMLGFGAHNWWGFGLCCVGAYIAYHAADIVSVLQG